MSYLVLARKWRPRSFDTLIGQEHVVRALTHALDTGRLHHAWLFTGTRGVGKTTLSRILAKSLNCEQGITSQPCGQCRACTEIDAGRFVDYIELDAASNRGVDEMTQLLEQAVYAPSAARYKVYMIDEVHMLTGHAFNAMLKTLEEPPEHVKFILATTDPQKIPVTVLSRCLQFNLKQMTVPAIVEHLQQVLQAEGIPAEVEALRLLARAAGGSMRDALSLTDQAISFSAGQLGAAAAREMLGTLDEHHLVRLLQALGAGDVPGVLAVADDLSARGLSYQSALADLAALISRIAIAQRLGAPHDPDDPLRAEIQALAQALQPDELQLFYAVAVNSRNELSLAPDEYAGFVMACLRMLALLPPGRVPMPAASSFGTAAATQVEGTPGQGDAVVAARAHGATPAGPAPAAVADDATATTATTAGADDTAAAKDADARPRDAAAAPAIDTADGRQAVPPTRPAAAAGTPDTASAVPPSATGPAVPADEAPSPVDEPLADEPPAWDDIPDFFDEGAAAGAEPDDESFDAVGVVDLAALPKDPQALPGPAEAGPEPAALGPRDWPALAASLPLSGTAAELARNSEWVGGKGDAVRLRVAIVSLAEGSGVERLRTVLSEHFGRVIRLTIECGSTGDETAHAHDLSARAARQQAAEDAVRDDPVVRALVDAFDARVLTGTIRPPAV